ncbi:MAG: hypothetical protein GWQ05_13250 [Verrucomicrobiaceae bacterium]|nr:hypothetical protein [Verrucomicrobiaceae bacterium]NCF91902.1 hypothetical protein [Verrucomicrobiaceae bacterium]
MEEHQLEVKAITDAKKETIVAKEGLKLANAATAIHAAKGKKLVSFRLKGGKLQGEATDDDLRKAIIGPSGNLRAPTIWVGKTIYVGFTEELYDPLLK